ncbi:MAG: kelch repeat-containing protein [bacterium]
MAYLSDIVGYDIENGSVAIKNETLPTARSYTASAYYPPNNKIYIFGGFDGTGSSRLSDIIEYNVENSSIVKKDVTLPTGRSGTSCVYYPPNNKIYIFGGYSLEGGWLSDIIEYDPATDTVSKKTENLPIGRNLFSCVYNPFNEKIYIFGGVNDQDRLSDIIEYNPATGEVVTRPEELPTARLLTSASYCTKNNKIYIFGGNDYSRLPDIIEYQPDAYYSTGTYTSASKNLGAKTYWDTISWAGEEPAETEITFNTRTSDDGTTWSGWSSSYTTSGSLITSATAQYIQVRANFSTSISSQTPVLYDFTVTYDYVDVSSPTAVAVVSDGLSSDSDVTFSQTQLSANWTAGSDAESGIKGYWYAIGTSSGGVDVSSWTYNGNVTSVTVTGLSLTIGSSYYFSVKAENNAGLKSDAVSSDGIRVGATTLDHYEVSAPTAVITGSLFTVTVYAKNDTNDTIDYDTSVTLQPMLSSEPAQAGSGILGVTVAGISNGVGTVTHQTYTKAEDIKIKATDGLDNTGLSDTIHMISSQQAALSISVNPSSILTGQTAQITVVLKDYYGNPISGGDVSFNITQGAGTVSPAYVTTDASGEVTATFTPDEDGSGSVIIYATSGNLTPVSVEIEVSELITTAGGTIVASNDNATKLVIPAGAVSANALMNLTTVSPETNQAVSYDIIAQYQTTGGKITDFNVPVTLTLHYNVVGGKVYNTNVDASDAANNIALFYHDGVQWQKIGGTVDEGAQTVTADVTHLSKYAIMASAKPKAFSMKGIGPNPFTPNPDGEYDRVHFYFDNPDSLPVTVKIYDVGGNLIKTITGTPGVVPYWNGCSDSGRLVEGGVYIYYLMVGNNRAKGTVVLAK